MLRRTAYLLAATALLAALTPTLDAANRLAIVETERHAVVGLIVGISIPLTPQSTCAECSISRHSRGGCRCRADR